MLLLFAIFSAATAAFFLAIAIARFFMASVYLKRHSEKHGLGEQSDSKRFIFINILLMSVAPLSQIVLPFMTWGHRNRLSQMLSRGGIPNLEPQYFFVLQLLSSFIITLAGLIIYTLSVENNILSTLSLALILVCLTIGFMLPGLYLRSRSRTRSQSIARALPFFLDMLSLGLNAGMSLQSALHLTLRHLAPGPLKDEWTKVLMDVRAGQSRSHALRQLSNRVQVPAVRQLVAALVQGESMGLSLTRTVLAFAKQLRIMRMLHAEKLAFEAPVKMLFPLAFCIFPCTFLVLGFPVVAKALGLS